jgi:PST family polysaccharide transporter
MSISASVALALTASSIGTFFERPDLVELVYLNALLPFIMGVSQVPESLLQRDLKFKLLTLLDGISFIFGYAAFSVIFAALNFGPISVIYGLVAQEILRACLLFYFRSVRLSLLFRLSDIRDLLKFGFGLSLIQITNMIAYQADNLVISKTLGAQALGLYSRSYQVITAPTKLIGNSLLKALFPAMSTVQNDIEQLRLMFSATVSGVAFVTMPVMAFLVVFAPEIVLVLLGEAWKDAISPFQILALAIFFRVGQRACEAVIRATGAVYQLWIRQLLFAVSVGVFAYTGVSFGLLGVSTGVLVSCVLNMIMLVMLTRSLIGGTSKAIVYAIMRHTALGITFGGVLFGTRLLLRSADLGSFGTLAAGALLATLLLGIPFWYAPRLFGKEGMFVSDLAIEQLKKVTRANRVG